MSKIKNISILIGVMILGIASVPVVAEADDIVLEGTLKGDFVADQPFGLVSPVFNLSLNQEADVNVVEDNGNYSANVTLSINVEAGEDGTFIGPRFLITRISVVKSDRSMSQMFNLGLLHPSMGKFKAVHIAGSNILGLPSGTINISFTMDNLGDSATSENVTVWILAMGFWPGAPSYPLGQSDNTYYEMIEPMLPGYLGLHVVNLKLNYIYP